MARTYRILTLIASLLVLFVILFISYRIGKKGGIKKALYRVSYISFAVLISFVVAPYLTEFILNFNLYPHGLAIHYNGLNFYRLIDFIEEVIVHSDVLNDIYNLIPNLKNLLMDFPQIIFIPFVYVLTVFFIMLVLSPIYFYLAYRRQRRVLYDASYKNTGKIWAGVLTMAETVFLISITLTPVNGIVRIYTDSKEGILTKDTNICKENGYLNKYAYACSAIEAYDNTIFNIIGSNFIDQYVYDSLTRIEYNNKKTSLNKEILTIAQAGMILNKTGLLDAMDTDFNDFEDIEDFSKIDIKSLSESEIDIMVSAFRESLYTKEVLDDLYKFASSYLNYILNTSLKVDVELDLTYDELIDELKIVLTALNYVLNNQSLINSANSIYKSVEDFLTLPYSERTNSSVSIRFGFSLAYLVDVDSLEQLYTLIHESKIYKRVIPKLIDTVYKKIGVNVTLTEHPEELDSVVYKAFGVVRIVQNHLNVNEFIWLLSSLEEDELDYIADLLNFISSSKSMKHMLYNLTEYGLTFAQLRMDIPIEVIYAIDDWHRELKLAQKVLQIVRDWIFFDKQDFNKMIYCIDNYRDTTIFDYALKFGIQLLPDAFKSLLAGKGLKYLVGPYV